MRILLTNDDGVNASGLKLLERIAARLSDDVWIVAPTEEQSGTGHSLTLTKPVRLRKLGEHRFCVAGTPTDSVMMGLAHILKDSPPDLILSGINRGANLAEDVTYSGTCSAAMEGALAGIPSIALSQAYAKEGMGDTVPFEGAEAAAKSPADLGAAGAATPFQRYMAADADELAALCAEAGGGDVADQHGGRRAVLQDQSSLFLDRLTRRARRVDSRRDAHGLNGSIGVIGRRYPQRSPRPPLIWIRVLPVNDVLPRLEPTLRSRPACLLGWSRRSYGNDNSRPPPPCGARPRRRRAAGRLAVRRPL